MQIHTNSMIKFLSIVVTVALFALVLPASANAQYWWDANGTTGGFQVANGDFGTSTFWNPSNTGVGTLTNWPGTTAEARINVNGTINLTVNSAVTAGLVYLGNSPSSGTVTSVNLSGSSTLTATDFSVGQLTAATASTATASLNQSSGTIVASGTLGVGRNGTTGTWNMSGGSASGAALWIGMDVRGGASGTGTVAPSGTMTISGGNMTLSGNVLLGRGAFNAGVAQTADATLNMNSGSLTTTTVSVGFANYSTGTVNLNGGTLTAANVQMASGLTGTTSTFRFNGGTLKSSTNSGTFMTGLNNAYVDSGGAIIDINGKTSTISQSLLQGTGTAGLTLLSSAAGGQLTLSGTNTYAGATTINGGSLLTLGGRALSDTASVILANAAGANLNVNASETVGGLQGGGTTGGTVNIAASQTLTVTNQATNHTFSGVVAGAGALTKTGNGTLTLVGSNSYTGTTTVNGGKLIVDGSLASGSTTVVGSGGLLGGSGKVGALNLQRGATLTPGNSPGLLTASSAVWGAGATYEWQLGNLTGVAGTDWDLFRVTGTLDMSALNSANKFNLTLVSDGSFDLSSGYEWTFAQAANFTGLSNSSAGTDITNLFQIATQGMGVGANPANVKVLVGSTTSDGLTNLNVWAVPEPSTGGLLLLGLGGVAWLRRRNHLHRNN
jgi:autotransporter-associated beta strand protein